MPSKSDKKRTLSREASAPTTASSGKPKRTRFASPGSDPVTFENQVDATLENPSAARRGRVNTEGYESDSSDDGEGVVESRKKGRREDEEDEDMFAMGEKEDDGPQGAGETNKKKKKQEFLRLGDIEGQEFADGQASADDLSEEEDEPEDEDDAERRKKAGMGFELSGFNMREEMEEGKFSSDGTFVRTFDPHGVHDRWMDGLDEQEIKKARRSKKLRERVERERIKKEDSNALSKQDAERDLVGYLRKSETVLEALHRLGIALKKAKSKHSTAKKPVNRMEVDASNPVTTTPTNIQEKITRITDLASALMSHGNTDIYSAPYEQLLRTVRSAGDVPPDWIPPSQEVEYEYRWAIENQPTNTSQVYGPYSHEEMLAWHGAKYFGGEGERVRVRTVGENDWHEWEDVMF